MRAAPVAPTLVLAAGMVLLGCAGEGSGGGACDGKLGALQGQPAQAGALGGSFARAEDIEALLGKSDVPAPDGPASMTSVIVGDFNGDGRPDILYNHDANGGSRGAWVLLQNDKGGFNPFGSPPGGIGSCLFMADLDGDGARDLVCANPGPLTVVWGTPAGLDWAAPTHLAGSAGTGPGAGPVMAAAPTDLDEDGWLDLVVSRYGSANQVYWNQGGRSFAEVSARWGLDNPGLTWAVAFSDFDGDGRADVYTMNDGIHNDTDANRLTRGKGPGPQGEPQFERVEPMTASCDNQGLFQKGPATPMGLGLGDLDGDGSLEMFFAMTNHDVLLTSGAGHVWADARGTVDMPEPTTSTGQNLVTWSPALWDVDHDGLLDVLIAGGDDIGHGTRPGRGTSHLVLYHGLAPDRFEDVHGDVGLGAAGQFMSAVRADLDGNLELDLLVGGLGQLPQVYRNKLTPNGEHLLLELAGQLSNPQGLGARVEVQAGSLRRVYQMGDRFGPRLGEAPILDVGLGAAHQADDVVVTWPSGYVQRLHGLASGQRHLVQEPTLVLVTPASRHAPADGTGEVVLEVRPTGDDGLPLQGAVVHIDAPFQTASWTGPEQAVAGGASQRTLRAPAKPGSVVIQVSVNGAPLRVRPRIWFD